MGSLRCLLTQDLNLDPLEPVQWSRHPETPEKSFYYFY